MSIQPVTIRHDGRCGSCFHGKTVPVNAPVRLNGAMIDAMLVSGAVVAPANVERVRCANCGEPRWDLR